MPKLVVVQRASSRTNRNKVGQDQAYLYNYICLLEIGKDKSLRNSQKFKMYSSSDLSNQGDKALRFNRKAGLYTIIFNEDDE